MEQKMVILKPIVWNSSGYMRPEGIKARAGFVGDNGFGGEEWNGNPDRVWKGQRVFHTQLQSKLEVCGQRGELGIIMTGLQRRGISRDGNCDQCPVEHGSGEI
jgi:hypothetical protein